MGLSLRELIAVLTTAYPPATAADWDTAIGLTCGDPNASVDRVLLAVDVDPDTVAEAIRTGAQLLLTHHPLLFRPVQSVAADTPRGGLVHRLVTAGVAHYAAHTNADVAADGVNVALAEVLGLTGLRPLVPQPGPGMDKLVVFVPVGDEAAMIAALSAAGAGRIGDYAEAAFTGPGTGQFRPLAGALPAIGAVGELERVAESRIEMVLPRSARAAVLAALRAAHRYEEPAFDLIELADLVPGRIGSGTIGSGRIGELPRPLTLDEFTGRVAERLPATVSGVRAAGDPARPIRTVAVCGGAGGSYLPDAAAAGVDAYVTADLSHHVVSEYVAVPGNPAVIEVSHWAGEWPWLARAAEMIEIRTGGTVATTVSTLRTDPWTLHRP